MYTLGEFWHYNAKASMNFFEYIIKTLNINEKLIEKADIVEIPIEIWKQLRSDLEMKKTSTKNEENLVGYC